MITAEVLIDLGVNIGTMTLSAGCTGGVDSPVVLICLVKIAGYGLIFSPQAGVLAIITTLGAFSSLVLGEQLGWWSTIPIDILPPATARGLEFVFRICVLGTLLSGGIWLFRQVARKEQQSFAEAKRAKDFAHREHAAGIVTGALLAVSEAVSRLTRLEDILNKVVDIAPRLLAVDYCGIFLWSEDSGAYRGAAVSGWSRHWRTSSPACA